MIASRLSNDQTAKLALDTNSLNGLRQSAKDGSPAALKEAATQFEAMFINMMMKSMRDATPQEGLMDNQQTKTFTTMLDQQMSQNLAKRGVGLADVLVRQLSSQQMGQQALAIGADGVSAGASTGMGTRGLPGAMNGAAMYQNSAGTEGAGKAPALPATLENGRTQAPHVRAFQEKLHEHAHAAEQSTGIPAKFMLGQAALETGWGKRMIKNADGTSSNNLFGIKAGPSWKGKVATAVTTEYVNGKPQTKVEKFRAYDSPADSFRDYARLIANNPRYEKVIASGGDAEAFAKGLQRAGYATDPNYAAKLTRLIKNSLA
ncbi:flagellar protein FlgJ [Massilia sp. UYP32]|uniref:Peptidoglycan hydrolase FlgJ n=2 Tax=Massilia timonae TaxID=47229 RepID=K9E0J2_9BURK|nr:MULTISPECIES: flagellar assembly peptidoglycan hydrolase FlgJ [Massilia]EKU82885.1 flagellar rod assembly protein/muramidase FlgJ [Massilia timonae CCUG 45783]OIJ40275.1 flagellar rod assembly protein/muramidase FlgJ [Massilia timonae]QYG04217.1 flagellar assembly peptidoglycan hydrolase FlgJ [Massilia sp. NP310]